MFIESREPDDERPGERPEPRFVTALGWLFPWPALFLWLLVASFFADGWAGVAFAYSATAIAAWRALRALPGDGLTQTRQ